MPRSDQRANDQLREVKFFPDVAPHATGSVLISFGNTRVICAATIQDEVPRWMKVQGKPRAVGLLVAKELEVIIELMANPKRPLNHGPV